MSNSTTRSWEKLNILNTSWGESIRLETKVAQITRQQEINGWLLDVKRCRELIDELTEMIEKIDAEILPNIPPKIVVPKNALIDKPFTKSGDLNYRVEKYLGDQAKYVKGPFSRVELETINLASDSQIKEYLLSLGWKPTEWNISAKTGQRSSPKLTEDSFESLKSDIGKKISQRVVACHRRSQLQGFLDRVRPSDGRIEARANTVGTPTGRFKHSGVVNVPKAEDSVFFGKQMRSVFIVPEGKKLVGVDASGLENRMLAHYMNNKKLTEIILYGDFHTTVWKTIEAFATSRSTTKNIEYALFYGAGDTKLGKMADRRPPGWDYKKTGEAIRRSIMAGLPALDKLTNTVKRQAQRGYLIGLDGRRIIVRSEHSALNSLLQCAGAVVMKVALCYLHMWLTRERLDCKIVGNFHDEFQMEVAEKDVERVVQLSERCIVKAGQHFKLNCPLEGEAKVGNNWAETH